mmetsp:Transcript_10896/g.26654  ORF Transcript_10896/g.26654 Transcript_10896/m.26654 type:complete len:243 (-) Transcript_10896:1388-2116(-)|eukprot:CAMPEP_0181348168 /NCGR_PEP_ID=MMETSP1106-20121128/28_1 /TAXON_ID=81844 /ORGANISM="Mantoniella antarctica, Strain SL-175" /LENGTH=242 /DNA_ID=CAMNT_0023460435 /DNA_START=919 /DNA_END=1647 /DNA_ORIENTATION=+
MKTFCEVCTAAPASLVCCADDAVMCGTCDDSIHQANSIVSKHERVAFKSTTAKPSCDICQVNPVFAICREDRAFLCRACDISIHSANEHVAKHERFLMSGVTVELNAMTSTSGSTAVVTSETKVATEAEHVQEVPVLVPQVAVSASALAHKKAKGLKRKEMEREDSFNFADGAVPTFMGSLDTPSDYAPVDAEFNSFVQDFLGPAGKESKGADVSMTNFLDNFFDDIPEDDFGVVPDMGFVQ